MIANATSYITSVEVLPFATSIGEGALLTGPKIATAYNIPASTGANVKVGIISLGGNYSQSDLNKSLANISLTAPTITFVPVDGATNNYTGDASVDGENMLDLVCVASMVPQANIVLYKGNNGSVTYSSNVTLANIANQNSSFGNAIQRAVSENCDIITISWGGGEIYSNVYPNYYCGDYLAGPLSNASANGITVFVATGDYGSSTQTANIVTASYPATNSNVIAVGGSNLSVFSGNSIRSNETAYNYNEAGYPAGFAGGGGISSIISVPTWQNGLTYREYFTSNSSYGPNVTLTSGTLSSGIGRGVPDIAAAMNAYGVWMSWTSNGAGSVYGFSGTSAAAPIMAGMFARYVSLAGRRPIPNAIHPVLYGNLNAYYDITTGNNASLLTTGYAASSNWDPVTGVGVPWGNVVYQMVSSGGTTIKTGASTWNYIANVKVKTATNTWSNVRAIWTKVDSTTWKQTF